MNSPRGERPAEGTTEPEVADADLLGRLVAGDEDALVSLYRRWRPLVRDAMQFVVMQLSSERLAPKVVEQLELPTDTPPERRLLRLIARVPGLQKIGQVLARNRELHPPLRRALSELENGISDVTVSEIRHIIAAEIPAQI